MKQYDRDIEALGAVILDKDSTIGKFRDYVTSLNEHNATLRQELQKHTDAPQEKQEPSQVIDYKKLFSESKANCAAIDLQLKQLELQQANQHVAYLKLYLPDNFMTRAGDADAVSTLLTLPRLTMKSDVLINGSTSRFPRPAVIDRSTVMTSHMADQWGFSS